MKQYALVVQHPWLLWIDCAVWYPLTPSTHRFAYQSYLHSYSLAVEVSFLPDERLWTKLHYCVLLFGNLSKLTAGKSFIIQSGLSSDQTSVLWSRRPPELQEVRAVWHVWHTHTHTHIYIYKYIYIYIQTIEKGECWAFIWVFCHYELISNYKSYHNDCVIILCHSCIIPRKLSIDYISFTCMYSYIHVLWPRVTPSSH